MSLALLVVLGIHLTATLRSLIIQRALENNIQKTLSNNLSSIPGARLAGVTLGPRRDTPVAWAAVVRTPQPISPEQVAHLNDLVNRATGTAIDLHVRSVIRAETTREWYVYKPQYSPADNASFP